MTDEQQAAVTLLETEVRGLRKQLESVQFHYTETVRFAHQFGEERHQLLRQLEEALKGRLLTPLWNVERDICRMSTRVSLDLPYCEFDECQDRKEFRRKLARELKQMGDAFMAAWDQLHGEQP